MKKRNKRTTVLADFQISPLTNHILARMGQEGLIIRHRLKRFFQDRFVTNQSALKNHSDSYSYLTSKSPSQKFDINVE